MSKNSYGGEDVKHGHYFKRVPPGATHLDLYAVFRMFGVTDAAIQHALKKLFCAGQRGSKTREQGLREAVDSVCRAIEIDDMFRAEGGSEGETK